MTATGPVCAVHGLAWTALSGHEWPLVGGTSERQLMFVIVSYAPATLPVGAIL